MLHVELLRCKRFVANLAYVWILHINKLLRLLPFVDRRQVAETDHYYYSFQQTSVS